MVPTRETLPLTVSTGVTPILATARSSFCAAPMATPDRMGLMGWMLL
jgi:hypothetical protein